MKNKTIEFLIINFILSYSIKKELTQKEINNISYMYQEIQQQIISRSEDYTILKQKR